MLEAILTQTYLTPRKQQMHDRIFPTRAKSPPITSSNIGVRVWRKKKVGRGSNLGNLKKAI